MSDDFIHTRIWREDPEADNPFATRAAYCHGYDVFGEMLGKARWVEMLYLLFRGEAPSNTEANLLEALAVALANPGPRAPSVHAAMCGGTAGSPAASALMAALAVGAGNLSGGREVRLAMEAWATCGVDLEVWRNRLAAPAAAEPISPWPSPEHPPGFDPHGISTATPVRQTLACFADLSPGRCLPWLAGSRVSLEEAAGHPLALSGIVAAAFVDLGFAPEQGEMLHLMLCLPGAAAHALEQWQYGHRKFPFFTIDFDDNAADSAKEST
ncbi:citryl-CoA lyase [Methylococcus sp. ANG]|uniref:citryl-CoA lyase n=1 Tax=Methylococcus sp. ANG TaxID=3231903 RepID=UPI003459BB8F